jgi:hypothetical protein
VVKWQSDKTTEGISQNILLFHGERVCVCMSDRERERIIVVKVHTGTTNGMSKTLHKLNTYMQIASFDTKHDHFFNVM